MYRIAYEQSATNNNNNISVRGLSQVSQAILNLQTKF